MSQVRIFCQSSPFTTNNETPVKHCLAPSSDSLVLTAAACKAMCSITALPFLSLLPFFSFLLSQLLWLSLCNPPWFRTWGSVPGSTSRVLVFGPGNHTAGVVAYRYCHSSGPFSPPSFMYLLPPLAAFLLYSSQSCLMASICLLYPKFFQSLWFLFSVHDTPLTHTQVSISSNLRSAFERNM